MSLIFTILGSCLLLASLPGTVELALVTFAGMFPLRDREDGAAVPIRKLAVVIPAHNEAGAIVRCIRSVAECMRPEGVEVAIVVVADNCTDATADLSRAANARVLVRRNLQNRGKGFALEFAFSQLMDEGFDVFFVVDADSVVDTNLIVEAVRLFRAGADGVQARYVVLNNDASLRTRLMSVALMAFNVLRPRGRERMHLSVGIFGNGFALSRATLKAVPYDAHSLVEDLEYHLRIVEAGRKIRFADRARVRADMPVEGRGVSSQRARWEGGRLAVAIQHLPKLIAAVFRGDWPMLEPALELMLLPLAFHVAVLVGTLVTPHRAARIFAVCSLAIVVVHVIAGVIVGGGNRDDFRALLATPFYIMWKLMTAPKILRSARAGTPWVRTDR